MNDEEAADYNGPTFNCPTCPGRHPLDGSETCVDQDDYAVKGDGGEQLTPGGGPSDHDADELSERPVSPGVFPTVDGPGPTVSETSDEDPRRRRDTNDGFEFVQGEDLSDDALEHATTTEREQFIGWFSDQQVAKMEACPAILVVERLDMPERDRLRVKFQLEVEVDV